MKKQIEAIVFRRNNKQHEFLLLKRISSRGNFWQPVTGGVKENESNKEAILRELKEETGIMRNLRIIENIHQFIFKDDNGGFKEEIFGIEVSLNEELNLDKNVYLEHSEYGWFSFEEAIKLLEWENNKTGLKKLMEKLK